MLYRYDSTLHALGGLGDATLAGTYFSRAHRGFLVASPEYAALHARFAGRLSPRQLMALVLDGESPAADLVAACPLVHRALTLLKRHAAVAEGRRDPVEWALFRRIDPAEAERVAASVRRDTLSRLADCLDHHYAPDAPATALKLYFNAKIAGDEAGARRAYTRVDVGMSQPLCAY